VTLEELEKYPHWIDEDGNLWLREAYFVQPSATFVMVDVGRLPHTDPYRKGGAIHSPLLSDLRPLVRKDAK